ncbi:MAG: intradiol ring-cleavage dioxygenase [Gemmatimonadales bacterium]
MEPYLFQDGVMSGDSHITRREMLSVLGAAGALALTGSQSAASSPGQPAPVSGVDLDGLDCVVTPAQTEGPYFVDERLQRADIRLDPTTSAVSEGAPLRLTIGVTRVDGNACAPVPGAMVDVWQCDALGVYSDVLDTNGFFDTRGRKFLRGYQMTDRAGKAEFLTVYPGWYAGRTVHIHFKVRVFEGERRAHEFTSQLYFDDALSDRVFEQSPYQPKGPRPTRNAQDGIYRLRNTGEALLLRVVPDGSGYRGEVSVGLRMG